MISRALPLDPIVAARHSQQRGTLRFFTRQFADKSSAGEAIGEDKGRGDGLVVYCLDDEAADLLSQTISEVPLVIVRGGASGRLIELGLETAALVDIIEGSETEADDWVARRELRERMAQARDELMAEFEALFGRGADVSYRLAGECASLNGGRGLSAVVSDICDTVYADTPSLRNEVLNRRNLTSQGAKARRDLLEVMIEKRYAPRLDLTGFGPERAMYEAVLFAPRLHAEGPDGWSFRVPGPSSDLAPAWRAMESILAGARDGFFTLDHLFAGLRSAPIGLLDGPIPVLVMAWLIVHSDDIAIYQDGTYQPRLTIEVVERAF